MSHTFDAGELPRESYSFAHGEFHVAVHLHPAYSSTGLFEHEQDPVLAWILVRKRSEQRVVHTLNAQHDAVMTPPFFLNVHEGAMGHSLPGSGRASLWTKDELVVAIKAYLDGLAPDEAVARARRFVQRLLRGELFSPGAGPLHDQMMVAEDMVYINARGLWISDPAWLSQALDEPSVPPVLKQLVCECRPSERSPLADAFYFERTPFAWWALAERIFIHAVADAAPRVLKFLVSNVLDAREAFPGVELIRIRGSQTVGTKVDSLVVLTRSIEDSSQVVSALARYQKDHPDHFLPDVPRMSQMVLPGVAVGSEPAGPHAGIESFGTLRVRLITEAVREAADRSSLGSLVERRFREHGIDPDAPHRNLDR